MKITKRQLARIIKEEIATVTDAAIEDVVMSILSDEGGAAGLEPIEDALEDLEDDEISLPDEPIEDVVGDVTGVKRHADGDFIDTTQLESKIRVTKSQLLQIIKEEKTRILSENIKARDPRLVQIFMKIGDPIRNEIESLLFGTLGTQAEDVASEVVRAVNTAITDTVMPHLGAKER